MRPLMALSAHVHPVGLTAGNLSALHLLFVRRNNKKEGERTIDQTWIAATIAACFNQCDTILLIRYK
jgi:hypothetical protein